MTGYEIIVHPMASVADALIRWIRLDVGLPEDILPDKAIKDDVMAALRTVNCKYFPYFLGSDYKKEPQ